MVDLDLILPQGSAVVLTVYDGRFGYPVIERVQRVDAPLPPGLSHE